MGGILCDSFFFFKQKTAYEMRISDWSSDVCSSDLTELPVPDIRAELLSSDGQPIYAWTISAPAPTLEAGASLPFDGVTVDVPAEATRMRLSFAEEGANLRRARSEEHTSELQSLMRISYAVFCLKQKKQEKNNEV